ncbi:diguanylate cyclase [Rivihabitans pingtungensis]|uniref:Diguanylate cyclase (GGDEF)-like protein n=1 Tax=Rivihabitans pingtungensis TaxID=1054498 RepID=A0A318KSQ3_9NEIS|nr:diguanylate cyclase [Rivihabitans pingtungensis]PXX80779.1 diguanylate cyclase (GGDEF)-like protein [Rivihabitans pingtungensis]
MWRVLQNCLLYVFLLCTVAPALAGGVLRLDPQAAGQRAAHQIDLLEDPSRILGLSDVQGPEYAERFLPASLVEGDINLGYSKSAYWLRLTVQAPQDHIIRNWLLELGFPALDHISAYIVDKHGWRAYQTGDMLTFDQRPYPHRHFIFPMLLDPGQITTIYLRVESQGTLTLPVMIWTEPALLVYSQSAYGLLALYYGMLLALALYNLLLFLSLRDPVYLAYVLFTVSMAIGQISLNGLGNQYLWPDWPAWGNVALPVGFALCGAFGTWFTRLFLHTRQTAPLYDRVLFGLGGIFAILAAAPLALPYQWVAVLVSLQGISFAVITTSIALFGLRAGNRSARWFLLAWSLLLAGILVMGARNLGWLPTNMLTTHAIQIGSALEMLLLSFALADRIHLAREEKEKAQSETLQAKESMVSALRQSEQLLETRVIERTRELAETNARLRISEARLTELAERDPLTGLANRRRLTEALYQALNQASDRHGEGALLLIDLDHFKPVNDRCGHEAGDRLLQEVARRLHACAGPMDTVARLGGDEFVLLLPPPQSRSTVETLADQLLVSLRQPVDTPAGRHDVSASIGIAYLPHDGHTPEELLKVADLAMYHAKDKGRDNWSRALATDTQP